MKYDPEKVRRVTAGLYETYVHTELDGEVVEKRAQIEKLEADHPLKGMWIIRIDDLSPESEEVFSIKKVALWYLRELEAKGFQTVKGLGICSKPKKKVERRFHAWVQADGMYRRKFHGKHASYRAEVWMRNKIAQLKRDGKYPTEAKVCWDRYEDGKFICTEVLTRSDQC